ncbi:MAG: trigger factor [Blautia sp.]|nr:trigger factor [Blautia sp.]
MKKKLYLALMSMCLAVTAVPAAAWAEEGAAEEAAEETVEEAAEETAEETTEEAAEEAADEEIEIEEGAAEDVDDAEETVEEEPAMKFEGITRLIETEDLSKYIKLPEYKGLELTRQVEEVTEESIEQRLQDEMTDYQESVADATVENGDTAVIDFVGTKDGVEFDGGSAEGYYLEIGSGTFIPGFEEGLVGMKVGETKDLDITFPEDYGVEDLNGAAVVFKVTIEDILRTPELTDEWVAENIEECSTIDEYRAKVAGEMQEEAEESADSDLRQNAWYEVQEGSEILEYPEEEIQKQKDLIDSEYTAYAEDGGMTLDEFIESQGFDKETYESEKQTYAEMMVKQLLIAQAVLDAEGIKDNDPMVMDVAAKVAGEFGVDDINVLAEYFGLEAVNRAVAMECVEQVILDNANVTTETVSAAADEELDLSELIENGDVEIEEVDEEAAEDDAAEAADAAAETEDTVETEEAAEDAETETAE